MSQTSLPKSADTLQTGGTDESGMMSVRLIEINDQEQKSAICDLVLRALPNWFGIESAIIDYVKDVKDMPFLSAFISGEPVGFIALKDHNRYTAEVHVMGILPGHHRQGIGRKLILWCEDYCVARGREFLTVKTLDEAHPSQSYAKTRRFYLSAGFRPLEVITQLWGEDCPCLLMAKSIRAHAR
jgi:GNAT superfamily N-acetyltransferase